MLKIINKTESCVLVSQKVDNYKERIVSKRNVKCDTNKDFHLDQIDYKEDPSKGNKKHNKFLGPYKITKLLKRKIIKIANLNNKDRNGIVHIKEFRKPPVSTMKYNKEIIFADILITLTAEEWPKFHKTNKNLGLLIIYFL